MRLLRLTTLAFVLSLAACDGAGDGGDANTFTVAVGDGEPETRREAYFGSYVSAASGETFAILLGTHPISAALSLDAPVVGLVRDGGAVRPGTYPLVAVNPAGDPPEDQFVGMYFAPAEYVRGEVPLRSGFYVTGEGSITIQEIDGERATGSFTMRAVEVGDGLVPSEDGVEVRGEFHAVHSEAFGEEGSFWR